MRPEVIGRCSKSQIILINDADLYEKLRGIFYKYSNNVTNFSIVAWSQVNKSVTGKMRKGKKNGNVGKY